MVNNILSPLLSHEATAISTKSIERLRPYIFDKGRSLVFFVGAGASMAGNTRMPSTSSLLVELLSRSLNASGMPKEDVIQLFTTLVEISPNIGFEITLNDFWQICRQATEQIYESFGTLEKNCLTNRIHKFMAYWLSTAGTVVTTNYDRLIEREWEKQTQALVCHYKETGPNSFANWQQDLSKGSCLFKIHGSLDDPQSCLGALEHVGTQLSGSRAELLAEIVHTRPLCFIGWQGIDPDIPLLLQKELKDRDPALPTFWIHYEGADPKTTSLKDILARCSPAIREYAGNQPIVTEGDRAFGEMLSWVGIQTTPNPLYNRLFFDFSQAIKSCSPSGVTRMVGITLRRAGKFEEAEKVLSVAATLALLPPEKSAAIQEMSLLVQQRNGSNTDHALQLLENARKDLSNVHDIHLQLNLDFGKLSMTIVALKRHPFKIIRIPGLFWKYREDIATLARESGDEKSIALHWSLLQLYRGRLRFAIWRLLGKRIPLVGNWILQPYNVAYSTIGKAKDIHLHSLVDVLAYRSIALAYLGHFKEATMDVPEIDRLVAILKDEKREVYWKQQKEEIEKCCHHLA